MLRQSQLLCVAFFAAMKSCRAIPSPEARFSDDVAGASAGSCLLQSARKKNVVLQGAEDARERTAAVPLDVRKVREGGIKNESTSMADNLGENHTISRDNSGQTAEGVKESHAVADKTTDGARSEDKGASGEGGQSSGPEELQASQNVGGWGYRDPEAWSHIAGDCAGAWQSPVDIDTSQVAPISKRHPEALSDHAYFDIVGPNGGMAIVNHGHNVAVPGDFGELSLPDGTYHSKNFNFHFPSEHAINGMLAAGELHLVLQRKNSTGYDGLAVIAILLQEDDRVAGDVASGDIAEHNGANAVRHKAFFESLGFGGRDSTDANAGGTRLPRIGEELALPNGLIVDLGKVFQYEIAGPYFHYKGSLTTPPCTESVHWYLLQRPASITSEQIKSFKSIFPSPSNNRPVQALNDRQVVTSKLASDDKEFEYLDNLDSDFVTDDSNEDTKLQ